MQKNQLEELNQKLSLAEGVCQEMDKDQEILEKDQKDEELWEGEDNFYDIITELTVQHFYFHK